MQTRYHHRRRTTGSTAIAYPFLFTFFFSCLFCCVFSYHRGGTSDDEQDVEGIQNFPDGTLQELKTLTGLDARQITNILGLIQGPEQSRTEWWLAYDNTPIWGFARNIQDGRGVTLGLFGATTGEGYNDADILWTLYGRNLAVGTADDIAAAIHRIQDDPKWHKAMFDAYITLYIAPVVNLLRPLGYTSPLTIGAVWDTAMNAGMGDDSPEHWGVTHLVQNASKVTPLISMNGGGGGGSLQAGAESVLSGGGGGGGGGGDPSSFVLCPEPLFLSRFLELRQAFPTKNSGDIVARIAAWKRLLRDQKWHLDSDDILSDYAYIPGSSSGSKIDGSCFVAAATAVVTSVVACLCGM